MKASSNILMASVVLCASKANEMCISGIHRIKQRVIISRLDEQNL